MGNQGKRRYALASQLFYQELTQEEAATCLDISLRTVKSRWEAARLWLYAALRGERPRG